MYTGFSVGGWSAEKADGVWSKISNALKRLGFRSRNFPAQLVSETSRACIILVRRSSLGRLWNALGAPARLCHRNKKSCCETNIWRRLCQEDEKSSCCTKDEGGPFGAAL